MVCESDNLHVKVSKGKSTGERIEEIKVLEPGWRRFGRQRKKQISKKLAY
jgi:predicted RNA-binding protein with PUA domain